MFEEDEELFDNLTEDSDSESSDDLEDYDEGRQNSTEDGEDDGAVLTLPEQEIEGDFERLVQNIRSQDASSGPSNILSRSWDMTFRDERDRDAEFKDDLRAASGIGKAKLKKRKGRTAGPILSQQVKALIGEGNQAYIDNNITEAMQIMQEVIRIEPRAAVPWSVLAKCYEDLNEGEKALQLRVMAAHLRHDAEEWERLARESRDRGFNQQALYCYRKVYALDPDNVDALWERASLAKAMGEFKIARTAYLSILKRFPYDITVLRELHTVLIELNELELCSNLLSDALESNIERDPTGSSGIFSKLDLLLLADLFNVLGEHERAIQVIRRGTRWSQGRLEQKYWDMCEDDREYDLVGVQDWPTRMGEVQPGNFDLDANARHRLAVARIKMGDYEEGKLHARVVLAEDVLDYSVLFSEIADAYFEKELYSDAKPIYELLGGDPATSSIYVLLQTAACMRNVDELRDAADVYEHVRQADPTNNDAKMKLAEIYEILGEPKKALELVYEVIDSRNRRRKNVNTDVDATVDDASAAGPSSSLFAEGGVGAAAGDVKGGTKSTNANRLTPAQLKELEAQKEREVKEGWRRMKEIDEAVGALRLGDSSPEVEKEVKEKGRAWMVQAEKLVDMFRETRNLFLTTRSHPFRGMFPRRRQPTKGKEKTTQGGEDEASNSQEANQPDGENDEERMVSRLQLDMERDTIARKSARSGEKSSSGGSTSGGAVTVFRGVSFDDWLRLIMRYSFELTKQDQYESADEILRHIMVSNAYQGREYQDSIRLAIIACAIHASRPSIVVEQCRKFITTYQFNNEPLRMLLACLASGLRPTDSFITSTLQKHLFREMKLQDVAVKTPEALKWNSANRRWALIGASSSSAGGSKKAAGKRKARVDDESDEGEDDDDDDEDTRGKSEAPSTTGKPPLFPLPIKENPIIVLIYGQICIAAKSYQSAIFYLLHAYDYHPTDPMICLCLAIASIGRAMQRQSDNRHYLVVQAMAFLTKYRQLRGETDVQVREVEFNFGRTFHQLGLFSHAVKHYQRVLEMAEKAGNDHFAKEAAYNLSLIFVFTGATPFADALYRKWLTI